MGLADLKSRIHWLKKTFQRQQSEGRAKSEHDYATDPVGYAHDILGVKYIAPQMEDAARACLESPYRVMIASGHKWGKSFFLAWMINWAYDSFPRLRLQTCGPSFEAHCDVVWDAVRELRQAAGLPGMKPKAPEITDGPGHVAKAVATSNGERFQGKHGSATGLDSFMALIFDEAVAIDQVFWRIGRTMWKPEPGNLWIACFNPTDITSKAYQEAMSIGEDGKPRWKVINLDCLDHPNIKEQLAGRPALIRSAVTLPMIQEWLEEYACDRIDADKATAEDLEWPPFSGTWWIQSPEFLARCRGIWPKESVFSLWNETLWNEALKRDPFIPLGVIPQIGVDVARYGDDKTAFHVRVAETSLFHSGQNSGWSTDTTADYAKSIAILWAANITAEWEKQDVGRQPIDAKMIPIKVDDDGVGGGVTDMLRRDGYNVSAVTASHKARGKYPNKRSELWFDVRDRARRGQLSFALLKKGNSADLARIKQQFIACEWAMVGDNRVVMPKDAMKEKIGRSPDDADAVNLAYAEPSTWTHGTDEQKPRALPQPMTRKKTVFG